MKMWHQYGKKMIMIVKTPGSHEMGSPAEEAIWEVFGRRKTTVWRQISQL